MRKSRRHQRSRTILSQRRTLNHRQSVAFHDATEHVAQSSRGCDERFAALKFLVGSHSGVIARAYVRSFKRNSRARGRSGVTVQGHARSRGAYPRRDVASGPAGPRSDRSIWRTHEVMRTFLPGTSRSRRVSWRPWSSGWRGSSRRRAPRRTGMPASSPGGGFLGTGTRDNFTKISLAENVHHAATRTIPDDLRRMIDYRWIIESARGRESTRH